MLHRFGAQVDAKLLEVARFSILEAEHVKDADEAVGGVANRVVEDGHRFARFPRACCSNGRCVLASDLDNRKQNELLLSLIM